MLQIFSTPGVHNQIANHVDILVTESVGAFCSLFAALRFEYILTFFGIIF